MRHSITARRTAQNPQVTRTVYALRDGPKRFNEIERVLDTRRPASLSALLKKMQRDNLIERRVVDYGPPACVTYSLTKLGRSLAGPAAAMVDWVDAHAHEVEHARAKSRAEAEAQRAANLKVAVSTA
jgi:DNA-binding HxlR family transcriptional regulator